MFYQVRIGITGLISWLGQNETREEVLTQYLCPFINREITFWGNRLTNMSSLGEVTVFQTERPIDSDWPIKKGNYKEYEYDVALRKAVQNEAKDVTRELYREAITLIETGEYKELRTKSIEATKGKYSFFICSLDNAEVDHNYQFVIKPAVQMFQFQIQKADEISYTGAITEEILRAITHSRFAIADLTDARPNCYYEVGYAHALGKPVIILAKEGTTRHFDISNYKWNFWTDYMDLKPKLDRELSAVIRKLGIETIDNLS